LAHAHSAGSGAGPERGSQHANADAPPPAHANGVRLVFDDAGIRRALMRIAHEILERNEAPELLYLVSIPSGGTPLARQLKANLAEIAKVEVPLGILDTTLYRDDLAIRGERPALRETEMPSQVDGRVVVLVDDVVKSGRTVRAAMDALMDFGRPRAVQLVGLVDRGHRELPIKLDYVGKNVPTSAAEIVRLQDAAIGAAGELEVVIEGSRGNESANGGRA
jgi:pyrimidine operon attenuation protein/uracil phosphoribosyltransferase